MHLFQIARAAWTATKNRGLSPVLLLLVGNRRERAQVGDQRVEVRGRELAGGIADHFAHRLCDDVAFRVDAGSQKVLQLFVAPLLEPRGREIRDVFAVGSLAPGEEAARLRPAEEIARRVAFAAMTERLHQIRAAVGDVREPGEVGERTGREEKPLPERHEEAPAERKAHLVLLAGPGAGRERSQVGPQIAQVAIDYPGERCVGKGGKVIFAVGPLALAHGTDEIGLGPASDTRLGMRGDVRAVERSERRLEGATAGERYGILLVFGVAADAAAGLCEIFAPLGIALSEGATEGGAEHKAEQQPNRGSSGPGHAIKHSKRPRKRKPRGAGLSDCSDSWF